LASQELLIIRPVPKPDPFSGLMNYSRLRMLITVTLICGVLGVVMGRIKYLRKWAEFYERAAEFDRKQNEALIVRDETKGYRLYNEVKAEEYRAAMWRPWTIVEEPSPSNSLIR